MCEHRGTVSGTINEVFYTMLSTLVVGGVKVPVQLHAAPTTIDVFDVSRAPRGFNFNKAGVLHLVTDKTKT